MENNNSIFGSFIAGPTLKFNCTESEKENARNKNNLFTIYIWGEKGIQNICDKISYQNYGKHLQLILFQYYLLPSENLLKLLKENENYRKKEKSIGIPVIVTDDNFFNKSEEERYVFLKDTILQKIDILAQVVAKKKLDTKIEILKSDLQKLFYPENY